MNKRLGLLLSLTLVIAITGCKKTISYKQTSDFEGDPTDYFLTLQVGKYATYRLDSLNFYYYGQLDTITSYLAKDSVESSFTDGSNHQAWLVTRYLSDLSGSNWEASQTYTVTPSLQQVWVAENNLRFLKLASPITEGLTWAGNSALPYAPFQDFFDFSDDSHLSLGDWTYTYQKVGLPYTLGTTKYDSTVTVLQANDSINVPILDPKSFGSKTYWIETYAKHIGLVYRHTAIWEYQPPTPNQTQSGYKIGFEITMTLTDHN
ncbi:MAG: hypothetical protein JST42_20820 [Bacteroidetes bacterium]|nr:hypothetical protein [Bacteroidota bacterium]